MRQPLRFFSIGLLTSTLILLGFYFFEDTSRESVESISTDDMIVKIEEDGYRVITEEEFISYSVEKENQEQKEVASKEQNEDKDDNKNENNENDGEESEEQEEEEVETVTFSIEQGFVTPDIADILLENKIIDDKQEFIDYMENNDYSPYIQLGTFEVTSEMSLKELAETVTTFPGD